MIDLTSMLGEIIQIKEIKHNNGSKIYPQNQRFFLDLLCQAQVFKYHLVLVFFSSRLVVYIKILKPFLVEKNRHGIEKKVGFFIGNGTEIGPYRERQETS